jgi:16S rRNA (guanine527-N7)-methyltransferase
MSFTMDTAQIAARLKPFLTAPLDDAQLRSISMYIDILLQWNRKINLTAVRKPEEIVTRHFGESLFAAEHLLASRRAGSSHQVSAETACNVVDVGSGAGFPGIPLKIFAPAIQLTLIESNQKKATFMREVLRSLNATRADVYAGRAEDFPAQSADLVSLRAVEHFESALTVAAGLVRPGGRLGLLIGRAQADRLAALKPGFAWATPLPVPLSAERILSVGRLAGT